MTCFILSFPGMSQSEHLTDQLSISGQDVDQRRLALQHNVSDPGGPKAPRASSPRHAPLMHRGLSPSIALPYPEHFQPGDRVRSLDPATGAPRPQTQPDATGGSSLSRS